MQDRLFPSAAISIAAAAGLDNLKLLLQLSKTSLQPPFVVVSKEFARRNWLMVHESASRTSLWTVEKVTFYMNNSTHRGVRVGVGLHLKMGPGSGKWLL